MASKYLVSIVGVDDSVIVRMRPGGTRERDLVTAVTEAAVAKGVGLFRTEAAVREAIRAAFDDVLMSLKADVRP